MISHFCTDTRNFPPFPPVPVTCAILVCRLYAAFVLLVYPCFSGYFLPNWPENRRNKPFFPARFPKISQVGNAKAAGITLLTATVQPMVSQGSDWVPKGEPQTVQFIVTVDADKKFACIIPVPDFATPIIDATLTFESSNPSVIVFDTFDITEKYERLLGWSKREYQDTT